MVAYARIELKLTNFRSIREMEPIELGPVTVLIGPNNAGKSSLIRGLYAMQDGLGSLLPDIRLGAPAAGVELGLQDVRGITAWGDAGESGTGTLTVTIAPTGLTVNLATPNGSSHGLHPLPGTEPNHFVVPYLSKRKTINYQEDIRESYALLVAPQFSYLAAKLLRLGNPSFPAHKRYYDTCMDVLGFVVTAVPSVNGARPGVYVSTTDTIPLEQMGEGVPNIVGLLAELALSRAGYSCSRSRRTTYIRRR